MGEDLRWRGSKTKTLNTPSINQKVWIIVKKGGIISW